MKKYMKAITLGNVSPDLFFIVKIIVTTDILMRLIGTKMSPSNNMIGNMTVDHIETNEEEVQDMTCEIDLNRIAHMLIFVRLNSLLIFN